MTTCTFTGHRPGNLAFGGREDSAECIRLRAVLAEQIERVCDMGVTVFNTGCALGTDMWAAEEVLRLRAEQPELRLKLHAYIPFEGQEVKWTAQERVRYRTIRAQADWEYIVSASYKSWTYLARNRRMVDSADIVIAVFDGNENRRSGTLQTINYAKKKNRPIIFISPTDFSVSDFNFDIID